MVICDLELEVSYGDALSSQSASCSHTPSIKALSGYPCSLSRMARELADHPVEACSCIMLAFSSLSEK
tara:strand:+ start:775 stop:978 length:204 start_codon:yes stop_codon:yes gene_type:complete